MPLFGERQVAAHQPPQLGTVDDARPSVIIGPTSSGKTCLVSALHLMNAGNVSTSRSARSHLGAQYDVAAKNDDTKTLFRRGRETIKEGRFPIIATAGLTEYRFDLEGRTDGWIPSWILTGTAPRLEKQGYSFSLLDGPGEAIFRGSGQVAAGDGGRAEREHRETLIEQARKSEGLILCADSSDDARITEFFLNLPEIVEEIGRPAPFRRVAIVLTKADRYFLEEGPHAQSKAETTSPVERMNEILGDFGRAILLRYLDRGRVKVACGWASVYGFVPNEGTPNYDPENDRLLVFDPENPQWLNLWRPFRVLDPFVFVATGNFLSMEELKL